MPNRILKESICTSETIEALSTEAEVFFYRLLVQCDDYGRMDARPPILRARCYPLRLDKVTNKQIEAWLGDLVRAGLVWLYEANDNRYLQVTSWTKHQQVRASRSKFPEPDINCNPLISDDCTCPRESRIENRESIHEDRDSGADGAKPSPEPPEEATLETPVRTVKAKPPALDIYCRTFGIPQPKQASLKARIVDTVGEDQEMLELWGYVCQGWLERGYKPRNISGLLDCFSKGGLESRASPNSKRAVRRGVSMDDYRGTQWEHLFVRDSEEDCGEAGSD